MRVGQFVGAVVIGEREQRDAASMIAAAFGKFRSAGLPLGGGPSVRAPRSFESAAIRISVGAARLLIHPRRSLVHAERTAGDHARGEARGKIGEEFAAIVVQAPACADHDFVVEHLRAPGEARGAAQVPMAARSESNR